MASVGLIHMGGRIYDPAIGRMLNADPFVQAPGNSQSFNRYSYVMNNPVSLIDPSGYLWNPIKKVSGAISRLGTYIGSRGAQLDDWQRHYTDNFGQWVRKEAANNPRTAALLQAAACAATSGVGCVLITGVSTAVLTQDIKAGLRAAAIAATYQAVAGAIGDYSGTSTGAKAARVGMHGVLGGAYSRYNHGSFWRGAISTMAAEGYAEFVPSKWSAAKSLSNGRVAHAMEAALIGGTSQVIMGGGTQGFVNGAQSAAMSRLFNYLNSQDFFGDGYVNPIEGGVIRDCSDGQGCGYFGASRDRNGVNVENGHEGVDILAEPNTPIRAPTDGVVWAISTKGITVGNGKDGVNWKILYMRPAEGIKQDVFVNQGDIIGYSRAITDFYSNNKIRNHIHFEMRMKLHGKPVNPSEYIYDAHGR